MKIKYIILPLVLMVIFSFNLACVGTESNPKTIEVIYLVLGTAESASLTYNNEQGGTEQMDIANLGAVNLYNAMNNKESPLYMVKGLENFVNPTTTGGMVFVCDSFPLSEFLYLSAQNRGSSGSITVIIIVNNEVWKSSTSSGAYVIATASGYYSW